MNNGFQLGDAAVVVGWSYEPQKREPGIEGLVTARGEGCVRLLWKNRLGFQREKWFSTRHDQYHVEKVELL